jgi:23S rRNA (pseudouridine1915-N3)-methyltransferase
MNIVIIAVDKLREPYVRDGCALYLRRLRPLVSVSVKEVRASTEGAGVRAEGEAILRGVGPDDRLWVVDQQGRPLSSVEVAAELARVERSGRRRLAIAIGGANGLSDVVRRRADLVWSLSNMTFVHEMARLIVFEQLYRAIKINRGEPYHR